MVDSFQIEDEWIQQLVLRTGQERFRPYLVDIRSALADIIEKFKEKGVTIITIGGTNGKGETAMSLYQYLLLAHKNVALWTSPHILSVTERMSYNGKDIGLDKLLELDQQLRESHAQLSFYEYLFAIFCHWINSKKIDFLILEVGLGGRYDAVNIFDADLAVITSIDLDHQEFLGNTRELILGEKYPISRPEKPLFTSIHRQNLRLILKEWTQRDSVQWFDLFELNLINKNMDFGRRNRILASTIYHQLLKKGTEDQDSILELAKTSLSLRARQELMTIGANSFIFIGAHNREGFEELSFLLKQKEDLYDQVWISFSKRSMNELCECLDFLISTSHKFKRINLCVFLHPKAIEKDSIESLVKEYENRTPIFFYDFQNWTKDIASTKGKSLVVGSYYFISAVQRTLLSVGSSGKREV